MKVTVDYENLWKFIMEKRKTDIGGIKKLKDESKLDNKMTTLVKAFNDHKKNQMNGVHGGKGQGKGKDSGTNALLKDDVFKYLYLPTRANFRINGGAVPSDSPRTS